MPQDLASPAMSTCRLYKNQHRGPHDFTWEMPFILLLYINIYFISTPQFPRITQQTKPHDHVRNTYKKQPAMNQRITDALPAIVHFLAATSPRGILLFRRTKSQASAGFQRPEEC